MTCGCRLVWPLYWLAQGTMFWALFVVGHDCGHQSFSASQKLNNLIGNIVHSTILVPYHGWRISHRKHHTNHGHVENDESWHPMTKSLYKEDVRLLCHADCSQTLRARTLHHASAASCGAVVTAKYKH